MTTDHEKIITALQSTAIDHERRILCNRRWSLMSAIWLLFLTAIVISLWTAHVHGIEVVP